MEGLKAYSERFRKENPPSDRRTKALLAAGGRRAGRELAERGAARFRDKG